MDAFSICFAVFATVVVILYLYYRFTGVNMLKVVILSRPVITAVAAAVDAVKALWPNDTLDIVHTALLAGAEATELAEKAWLMGELDRDDRNAYAKGLAYETLEKAGVVVDDRVKAMVNGIIEATCMLLPHGVEPEVVEEEVNEG